MIKVKLINDIVTEITKIKMTLESQMHNNDDIKNSIPPLNEDISVQFITDAEVVDVQFDIDEILDKISTTGIESLTTGEKDFLDKRSRDI